jgi:hypothetical protein
MRTKLAMAICITSLAMSGWASSASAHHAFAAEFDANKPVNFTGTITKMEWVNPHCWLHIAVKQTDGTVVNWAIEAGTPLANDDLVGGHCHSNTLAWCGRAV